MAIPRTLAALLLTLAFAAAAFAQESVATSEFGRSSGGELAIGVKQPSRLSGSIGIAFPLLSTEGGRRNAATLGGTLVKDHLWFFATAEKMDVPHFSNTALNAQLGDRQSFDAALRAGRDFVVPQSSTPAFAVPSSFLSLRYTGIVSSNSFFSASFSRSSQRASTLFAQPQ